jgi:formylglycine-generating enzyme required for sulfatase activity
MSCWITHKSKNIMGGLNNYFFPYSKREKVVISLVLAHKGTFKNIVFQSALIVNGETFMNSLYASLCVVIAAIFLMTVGCASGSVVQDRMLFIKGGTFMMGSPVNEPERREDELLHQVTVADFWMGKYEVTQSEWEAVMGSNPSFFRGNLKPVDSVGCYSIFVFCNMKSVKGGLRPSYSIKGSSDPSKWGAVPEYWNDDWSNVICDWTANGYRLPTEAEWEYACRAGTSTAMTFGGSLSSSQAQFNGTHPYNGGALGTYIRDTMPVGSYPPNAWGLYDMHGNIWEWCWDRYSEYDPNSILNPRGPSSGGFRVNRGGSWQSGGGTLRSAGRGYGNPSERYNTCGFRLVRTP